LPEIRRHASIRSEKRTYLKKKLSISSLKKGYRGVKEGVVLFFLVLSPEKQEGMERLPMGKKNRRKRGKGGQNSTNEKATQALIE